MLSIQEFAQKVGMGLKEYLPEEYQNVHCEMRAVTKNNSTIRTGIEIRESNNPVGVIMYLEDSYEDYQNGRTLEDISPRVAQDYVNAINQKEVLGKMDLMDFDLSKDYITAKLINKAANRRELAKMPHKVIEDLAIIYQVLLPPNHISNSQGTIKITHNIMEGWDVTPETLHNLALVNTKRICSPVFQGMDNLLKSEMGVEKNGNLFEDKEAFLQKPKDMMYVLTNDNKMDGAINILYPEILSCIEEVIPEGFYILPSSIHESLIVPKSERMMPKELGEMVREVNATQVDREETLSDRIYEYDKDSKGFHQVAESMKKREDMER